MNASSDSLEPPAEFPAFGRLLALDYGTKRVGLAVSTPEQNIASPIETYTRRNAVADAEFYRSVIRNYNIVGIVVGLPMHISGDEGGKAREARVFGEAVRQATALPVTFWDERYSSSIAEDYLLAAELTKKKRKAFIDQVAAQVFLQSYLDRIQNRDR
ncbi:MAG: Holliday junction resolvase RuvX [Planctomycetota bacterium]|jgi:putative Holliday junction resolvase|nr:Holliday junction resolvase RuvX [Planctomycetota bacterium]MDA1212281.1 Holliday junction resolvase RuvX [Planctomycetota bacterium]